MNRFLTITYACVLSLSATACSSSPKMITGNPEGVSYTFDGSDDGLKYATEKAAVACQNNGKVAVLKNVSKTDDSRIAHFDCTTPE